MNNPTNFRQLLKHLMGIKGSRSSWLPTLGSLLSDAFEREKAVNDVYKGDVFKDRIGHSTADGEGD